MNRFIIIIVPLLLLSCSSKPNYIGIQPYGKVDKEIIDSVSGILKRTYKLKVLILEEQKLPKNAFVNIKSPRYRADSLLTDLVKNRPDSIDYIIGITSKDISTTKRDSKGNIKQPEAKYLDWGIFGLGYKPGVSCVISTYRLNNARSELYTSRVQKIAVHEIGHNMGLDHCETEKCVMQDAVETITTVDTEGFELCEICYKKL
jgi:archaemetzincin